MLDLNNFEESPHLLDLLLQMEDVLDSLDLYVFKNWFKGEVVEGPIVHRYWIAMSLRFPLEKMPDPKGAKRLLKQEILCNYEKVAVNDDQHPEKEAKDGEEEKNEATHWLVEVRMPRRLLADMNAAELDFYDDDLDVEDVQDAQDAGMTDETSYDSEENQDDQEGQPEEATDAVNF